MLGVFSKAEYDKVAPYFGLDSGRKGADIEPFNFDLVYIPKDLWETIMMALGLYQVQYGLLKDMYNERGVGHFFSNVCPIRYSL